MSSDSVKVKSLDEDSWVVTVSGSISFSNNQSFKEALDEALSHTPGTLLVDLTEVSFCNSQGFGDLLRAYTRQVRGEGRFGLVGPTAEIRKVLEITKFSSIIEVHPNLEAAKNA